MGIYMVQIGSIAEMRSIGIFAVSGALFYATGKCTDSAPLILCSFEKNAKRSKSKKASKSSDLLALRHFLRLFEKIENF